MFMTWFFIVAPMAFAAGAASFFGSHPNVAAVMAKCMNVALAASTLFAKLVTAFVAQKTPDLTEDEMFMIIGIAAALVVFFAMRSLNPRKKAEVRYANEAEALEKLRDALPDGANVVIYEDVTGSNWMVEPMLHSLRGDSMNPYQIVRACLGRILAGIDTDQKFLYYAFGSGMQGAYATYLLRDYHDTYESHPPLQGSTSTTSFRTATRIRSVNATSSTSL